MRQTVHIWGLSNQSQHLTRQIHSEFQFNRHFNEFLKFHMKYDGPEFPYIFQILLLSPTKIKQWFTLKNHKLKIKLKTKLKWNVPLCQFWTFFQFVHMENLTVPFLHCVQNRCGFTSKNLIVDFFVCLQTLCFLCWKSDWNYSLDFIWYIPMIVFIFHQYNPIESNKRMNLKMYCLIYSFFSTITSKYLNVTFYYS